MDSIFRIWLTAMGWYGGCAISFAVLVFLPIETPWLFMLGSIVGAVSQQALCEVLKRQQQNESK